MARGRHRADPVRRPLPRPLSRPVAAAAVGTAVGGTLLAFSLGVAVIPFTGTAGSGHAGAAPSDSTASSTAAAGTLQFAAALDARDKDRASRSRALAKAAPSLGLSNPVEQATTEQASTDQPPTGQPTTEPVPPAPAPAPDPAAAIVGQLWVAAEVNVRADPSTDQPPVGHLAAITQVDVTGATENGWTQVVTDGVTGWVKSLFLSESQPDPQAVAASGVSEAACSISPDIEVNLTSNARAVYRAVCAALGSSVSSFGGYRPGDSGDHGSGRAVDIMVSGDPGWDIVHFVQAHASELNVSYVIYQQQIWLVGNPTSQWKFMEDRGSTTANHYDHVHVSVY